MNERRVFRITSKPDENGDTRPIGVEREDIVIDEITFSELKDQDYFMLVDKLPSGYEIFYNIADISFTNPETKEKEMLEKKVGLWFGQGDNDGTQMEVLAALIEDDELEFLSQEIMRRVL